MRTKLTESFTFEAAHSIPDSLGEYGNVHGHSHTVHITISGPIDSRFGWVIEQNQFRNQVEPYIRKLDHSYLNDLLEHVTAEGIANWLFSQLSIQFPEGVYLESVRVCKTTTEAEVSR